jgi:hypothetical protein
MTFILVNPNIESLPIKSNKKSKNTDQINSAAEELWSKFSKNLKDYADNFYFSFMESGSNKIYHYQVNETLKNNKVKYSLKKYKNKNMNDKEFVKLISDQNGGKIKIKHKHKRKHNKHDEDDEEEDDEDNDDSSSSSEEEMVYSSQKYSSQKYPLGSLSSPIYSPQIYPGQSINYYPNIYGVNNVTLPTLKDRYFTAIKDGKPVIVGPAANGQQAIYNVNGANGLNGLNGLTWNLQNYH